MSRAKKSRKAAAARKRERQKEAVARAIGRRYVAQLDIRLAAFALSIVKTHAPGAGPRPGEVIVEMPPDNDDVRARGRQD